MKTPKTEVKTLRDLIPDTFNDLEARWGGIAVQRGSERLMICHSVHQPVVVKLTNPDQAGNGLTDAVLTVYNYEPRWSDLASHGLHGMPWEVIEQTVAFRATARHMYGRWPNLYGLIFERPMYATGYRMGVHETVKRLIREMNEKIEAAHYSCLLLHGACGDLARYFTEFIDQAGENEKSRELRTRLYRYAVELQRNRKKLVQFQDFIAGEKKRELKSAA